MRLPCPYCGSRGNDEFIYLGSADPVRPASHDALAEAWTDYVFLRDNPAGANRELWHHTYGCRAWLIVTRDTRTHEVLSAEPARAATAPSAQVAAQ
jgi:heterotetrameric sarcosine oxidase delta subunit